MTEVKLKKSIREWAARTIWAFDASTVLEQLRRFGVREGDALMVHSSWRNANGFAGRPSDMIAAFQRAVGTSGLLVMPSLTYQNKSSREFLLSGTPMDVRRSPSRMGLLSEVFRRSPGVVRSASPTHPLVVWGRDAIDFIAQHDKALVPFGKDSPFARLLDRDGKLLVMDGPFSVITFTHFVEDRIASTLPFPLYEPEDMVGVLIDGGGTKREIPVRVLTDAANELRREDRLIDELTKAGGLRRSRLGRVSLLYVECRTMVDCADRLVSRGFSIFDSPPAGPRRTVIPSLRSDVVRERT